MKTKAYIVPHSHWDREWYIPFEHHRARLVALMDSVIELLQTDEYTCYHLDGQTIALEDYLEIRPDRREILETLVREGRLKVGPWYVLQDTYLTGSEANVRNMLQGTRIAEQFGGVCRIGYLPDAFGNAGQFPQLFRQSDMKAAVFGRGVKLMGRDGEGDPENLCPRCSEFLWEGADGSRIPSIYFANWYSNGMEIPTEPEAARTWWKQRIGSAEKFAATGNLLFMNGCDHQPVQKDLPEALRTARGLYPDVEFIQSSLDDYADAVLSDLTEPLEVVSGELEGQQTNGHGTLRNTASARRYIKALNRENENLLALQAEPLSAMAAMAGAEYDRQMFDYAWKTLIQNHPHDSICGCSIDEVHRGMEDRFHRSLQLGGWLTDRAQSELARRIDAQAPAEGETGAAFAVWNPGAWSRTATVEAIVCVERMCGTRDAYLALSAKPARSYRLLDPSGAEIPCRTEDLGAHFAYDLPGNRFRVPRYERRVRVTFEATDVPAFGYSVYRLAEGEPAAQQSLLTGARRLENDFLRADVCGDGSVTVLDKRTGRTYAGLGVLEDVGDVGDEYVFQQAVGGAITTAGVPAGISVTEDCHARASIRADHVMRIPACADAALEAAVKGMLPRETREIGRSEAMTELHISVTYSLSRSARQLEIRVEGENNAKDHRLRILFPTDAAGDSHYADSVFDLVRRTDVPGPNWINPSRCDHMQMFVAAADGQRGLAAANRGLYEYEILDDRRTLALTLLRAVGELGDWGVFPTPEAQCQGRFETVLALIPLDGEKETVEAFRLANVFQTELQATCILSASDAPETPDGLRGTLPAGHSFLKWQGEGLICTCFKAAEDGNGRILRLFNASSEPARLSVDTGCTVRRSDILETAGERISPKDIPVSPKEIITLRLED